MKLKKLIMWKCCDHIVELKWKSNSYTAYTASQSSGDSDPQAHPELRKKSGSIQNFDLKKSKETSFFDVRLIPRNF